MLKLVFLWSALINGFFAQSCLKHVGAGYEGDGVCAAKKEGERAQALVQVGRGILMPSQKISLERAKKVSLAEEPSELDHNTTNGGNTSNAPSLRHEPRVNGYASRQEASNFSRTDRLDNLDSPQIRHDQCINSAKGIQYWINVVIVAISVIFAMYMINVTLRTLSKGSRVQLALEYELQQDSCNASLALHEAVSGIGTILYLRWLLFLLAMAALCFAASFSTLNFSLQACPPWTPSSPNTEHTNLAQGKSTVTKIPSNRLQSEVHVESNLIQVESITEKPADSKAQHDDEVLTRAERDRSNRTFQGFALSYFLVVACSLVFSALQLRKAHTWSEANPTYKHFAVLVSGLPADATDPEKLKTLFQSILDSHQALTCSGSATSSTHEDEILRVVGVSIAYDYRESRQLVEGAIDAWQEDLMEDKMRSVFGEPKFPSYFCRSFLLESSGTETLTRPLEDLEKEVKTILPGLQGSGHGIVVLSSATGVGKLIKSINAKVWSSDMFFDLKWLRATAMPCEPVNVSWGSFACENTRSCVWLCATFAALAVMGICQTPILSAVYYQHLPLRLVPFHPLFALNPGQRFGIFKDICLGCLIAIGGTAVIYTLRLVCKWFKFSDKERRDSIMLSLGFLTTSLNAFCGLFLLLMGAQFVTQRWKFEDAIVHEVMAFVLPAYLIVPHLARFIFKNVLPWWLWGSFQDFNISRRYVEILTNFTIALGILLFAPPDSWKVSIYLLISLALMYTTDISKLLSGDSRTFYGSTNLSDMFAIWWSVPTGCLGAVAIWWAAKSRYLHLEDTEIPKEVICAAWIPCHVVVYVILLLCMRRFFEGPNLSMWTYEDASATLSKRGIGGNYFNTNPVFCLRSRFLHAQPCIPYVKAKRSTQKTPQKICEDL